MRTVDFPTFQQLCAITRSVLSADPDLGLVGTDPGDLEEAVKVACAHAGFVYSTRQIEPAVRAVLHVHSTTRPYVRERRDDRPVFVPPLRYDDARDILSRLDALRCLHAMPGGSVDQRAHEDRLKARAVQGSRMTGPRVGRREA